MEYIELQNLTPGWVAVAGWIGVVLFLVATLVICYRSGESTSPKVRARGAAVGYFMLFPMIGSMALIYSATVPNQTLRLEQLTAQISDSYGIELKEGEARELEYPREKPTGDFESFGSFERMLKADGELLKREIYLIWEDGEFYLAQSATGEEFTELEVQR